MIKFEEHQGQLFRMLDEPVPLTPDSKLPCLTRLIQDDSRMGMFNRDTKPSRLSDFYLAARIVSNNIVVDEFMESDYHRFEIIGYPVADGSAEWALYQMMQGKMVCHETSPRDWYRMYNDHAIQNRTVGYMDRVSAWLESTVQSGWQIYKEPETDKEPIADCDNCKHRCTKSNIDYCQMYEPKPTFKVGDWVEWCGDQYMVESAPPQSGGRYDIRSPYDELGCSVYPENITRKLSPFDVEVDFGFAKGRILSRTSGDVKVLNNKSVVIASIIVSEITNPTTRSLVESLLKAQKGEK